MVKSGLRSVDLRDRVVGEATRGKWSATIVAAGNDAGCLSV
jgi:hypothetical protein